MNINARHALIYLGLVIVFSGNSILGRTAAYSQTLATPSPNGTIITAPTSNYITDTKGNVWSFGGATYYGYVILKNGTQYANGQAVELTINNGVVWAYNNANSWYMDNGYGWTMESTAPASSPVNGSCGGANATALSSAPTTNLCTAGTSSTVSGTGPGPWSWTCTGSNGGSNASCSATIITPSPNGAMITAPTNKSITDAKGNVWSFGGLESTYYGYVILKNGTQYFGGQAVELINNNGVVWAYNAANSWYMDNGNGWSIQTGPVVSSPVNGSCGSVNGTAVSTTPTTNLCSNGTASTVSGSGPWSWTCPGSNGGNNASCSATIIAFSPNGTMITAPTNKSITDAKGNVWSFGGLESTYYGYVILKNGTQYFGGQAVKLMINNGVVWAYNNANSWYMDNGNGWTMESTAPAGSPVNGSCGSVNGTAVSTTPTTNLCSNGTASTVSGSGPWSWACAGSSGGTNASCLASVAVAAINGVCGSSNSSSLSSTPTTNLCSSGTSSTISGTGPWSWTCTGSNGGASATCSASVAVAAINGVCGSSNSSSLSSTPTTNLCSSGAASTVTGSGPWIWSCTGSNGGSIASCLASVSVVGSNGVCGGANGTNVSSTPTNNLCSVGTASAVSGPGPWSWTCSGTNGGANASCSAELSTLTATGCANFGNPLPAPVLAPNAISDEFVGPFASWTNLKTKYGAVGNGVTDDTAAIQHALNDLTVSGNSPNLYVPPGTYLVTQTLTMSSSINVGVVGADPTTTTFKWGGASGGTLLHLDGVGYARVNRITFEGSGTAGVLLDESSASFSDKYYDTADEFTDDVFQNAAIGIQGGLYDVGASETSVLRDKFINLTSFGVILKNYNALDWWIWDSYFQNDAVGVSNNPGAGNFQIYDSFFNGSIHADISILSTGQFAFRDNFSLNSSTFLYEQYYYTNAAATRVQGNTVVMPQVRPDGVSDYVGTTVSQGNMGPAIFTDNTFISPPNPGAHPPIEIYGQYWPDCVMVGNTFTVSSLFTCMGGDPNTGGWDSSASIINQENQSVLASSVQYTVPSLPKALPNYNRQVFDVPAGASAATVQQAINNAAAFCGQRPVVHLPYGTYSFNQTVTIPADCNIQLVGDGGQTIISGTGTGPVIKLNGPSKAILRDFILYPPSGGTGIEVENADQPGARVYMQQPEFILPSTAGLFVDSLDYTNVELDNAELAPISSGTGLQVVGGPQAQAGNPQYGRTSVLAGSGGNNVSTFNVSKGGSLIVQEFWDDAGNGNGPFSNVSDNSTFTLEGSELAGMTPDSMEFNNLSGNVTVMNTAAQSDFNFTNNNQGHAWILGNNFWNMITPNFTNNLDNGLHGAFSFNRVNNTSSGQGSVAIPDSVVTTTPAFINTMLAQSRATHRSNIMDLADGITDARFYRVWLERGNYGVHIQR